jgi:hypothetical protein
VRTRTPIGVRPRPAPSGGQSGGRSGGRAEDKAIADLLRELDGKRP